MRNRASIDLLVPGLLGSMPSLHEIDARPEVPFVEKCLSRSDVSQIDAVDYPATLFHLFGLNSVGITDFPTAPLCRLADGGPKDDAYWLQASPVHLRPDGDGLLLFDAGVLHITMDEAQQLTALVQEHFSDQGWDLEVYAPQRWYLRLQDWPDLQTFTLTEVIGRNIDGLLPQGKDASAWQAKMTEVQMLLHMSEVNLLRDGRGQLPINGVWLHGGGSLPSLGSTGYVSVVADGPLVRGMAMASEVALEELPDDSAELSFRNGRHLVVYDLPERSVLNADPYGWIEALEGFNAWIAPLLDAVRSRRVDHIDIYPCNGRFYTINASNQRRFWKKRRAITYYMD